MVKGVFVHYAAVQFSLKEMTLKACYGTGTRICIM